MARRAREKPERLAEKLWTIRDRLGLSQSEMLKRLGAEDEMAYSRISEFESGKGEPTLPIILRYARAAGVHVEDIIDDELELPERLPGRIRHEGIRRSGRARPGKKKR